MGKRMNRGEPPKRPNLKVKPKAEGIKKSKPAPKPKPPTKKKVEGEPSLPAALTPKLDKKTKGEKSTGGDGSDKKSTSSPENILVLGDAKATKKKAKAPNKKAKAVKEDKTAIYPPAATSVDVKVEGKRKVKAGVEAGGDASNAVNLPKKSGKSPRSILSKEFKPPLASPIFEVVTIEDAKCTSSSNVKPPPKGSKSKSKVTKGSNKPDTSLENKKLPIQNNEEAKCSAVTVKAPKKAKKGKGGSKAKMVKKPMNNHIQTPSNIMDAKVMIEIESKRRAEQSKMKKVAVVDNVLVEESIQGQSAPIEGNNGIFMLGHLPSQSQSGNKRPPPPPLSDGSFLRFCKLNKEERLRGYEESNLDPSLRFILEESITAYYKTRDETLELSSKLSSKDSNFQNAQSSASTGESSSVSNYGELVRRKKELEQEYRVAMKRYCDLIDMYNNAYMKYQAQASLTEQEGLSMRNLEDKVAALKEECNKAVKELEAKMQDVNNKTNWCRKQYEREKLAPPQPTQHTHQDQGQDKTVLEEKAEQPAAVGGAESSDDDEDNFLEVDEKSTALEAEMKKVSLASRDVKKIKMKLVDFPDKLDCPSAELPSGSAAVDLSDAESTSTSGSSSKSSTRNKSAGANDSAAVAAKQIGKPVKCEDKKESTLKKQDKKRNVGGEIDELRSRGSSSESSDSSSSDDDDDHYNYSYYSGPEKNQMELEDSDPNSNLISSESEEESASEEEEAVSPNKLSPENVGSTATTKTKVKEISSSSTSTDGNKNKQHQNQNEKVQERVAVIPASQKSIAEADVKAGPSGNNSNGNKVVPRTGTNTTATTTGGSKSVRPIPMKKNEGVRKSVPIVFHFDVSDTESEIADKLLEKEGKGK